MIELGTNEGQDGVMGLTDLVLPLQALPVCVKLLRAILPHFGDSNIGSDFTKKNDKSEGKILTGRLHIASPSYLPSNNEPGTGFRFCKA